MKTKKLPSDVDKQYKKKFTFKCPVRGIVTQEVLVTVYKTPAPTEDTYIDPDIRQLLGSHIVDDLEENGFQVEEEP